MLAPFKVGAPDRRRVPEPRTPSGGPALPLVPGRATQFVSRTPPVLPTRTTCLSLLSLVVPEELQQPTTRLHVRFYVSEGGAELFRDELNDLGLEARAAIVAAIKRRSRFEHFAREDEHVRGRVRAIRTTYDGAEYRALYALVGTHDEVLLGLHAVNKKSQKLPKRAIGRAEQRLADWQRRGEELRSAGAPKALSAKTDILQVRKGGS